MKGKVTLPGDKSIAHRAVILSALSQGETTIKNIPLSEDCLATIDVFKKLGIKIVLDKTSCQAKVFGKGFFGLSKPDAPLYIKESGTTFRLLLGVLAPQHFSATLKAGPLLSVRPMLRVINPLRSMGAAIKARKTGQEEYPPVVIKGADLKGITYKLPVASAQVKSAVLLAGLYANGKTTIIEPFKTRDHTERMLKLFKAGLKIKDKTIILKGGSRLRSPSKLYIPSDISSAAFFMIAASIIPHSEILIKNVSLNPGRIGIIHALKKMGVHLKIEKSRNCGNEPVGDIRVKSSCLCAIRISKKETPSLIDELPILMVAACFAKGVSVFENVGELRVKETDRIKSMISGLRKMGADIKVVKFGKQENIVIKGVESLYGAKVSSFGDHRTAMSLIIAGLSAQGKTCIDDISCINKSFPGFLKTLKNLHNII